MEIMEAADLEKQKHNNTRMEALVRLSKLEVYICLFIAFYTLRTVNADLARSLAATQKNLEIEVLENLFKLKRKMSVTCQNGDNLVASKGVEFELKMLEAEYSFVTDEVECLQEKAKKLEMNIETTQTEIENPTEVEIQLKQRLDNFTVHLIQKQAQVESLYSIKAMLLFRIEDENKSIMELADFSSTSSRDYLESSVWEPYDSKFRPLFKQKIRSSQQHLGSLIRQLDSIFSSGVIFLRKNSTARIWSLFYFVCHHLWVLYILTSHSSVSDSNDTRSGVAVSRENINNTGA
ncbi:golgin candidate 2 [Olea europaea subsp. europaea]|uniref:Golgin candidate 2 n=1 Tax=Olea europaea subsp. europaea TaxID=158383 RepID=A0A8S0QZ01_OLEEU|nr:golgin candidate 2 [Olea europaea subsp. europaea]